MLLAAPLSVRAQTKLTLQEALARALQVNNTVERSRIEINVAEQNRKQLLSSILPQVNLTGSTIENSKEVAFGSGADARTILPATDWNYRVVLSQPIYAGLREKRAYDQAKIGIVNAREGVLGTEDAVLLRVASNYLAVANAEANIAIEQRNIEIAEKRKTQSTAFYQAGEVTKVDVLRAETAIKASQRLLASAQQQREAAESALRADLDLTGDITVASPDSSPESSIAPMPDEQTLVSKAEAVRPDVAIAQNNIRVAELEVQKQRGAYFPVVTFDAGYINQKAAFPTSHYGYGAFRFSVPIWQSGQVSSRIAQAKEREQQARLLLEDAKIAAREDVHRAVTDLNAADTTLQLAKEQLAAAEAEYAQVFELYRAQESTSLDLATSEVSLADARRAVAAETLNHNLAQLRVWYAAGAIKDAVGVGATQR
ncbi:MAG: outer membrane protein [Thermoanaerobaculia bacterium]|jgi:outer membrane protein|nr:outer membrane protein [Thermoanaerobaculia bacterium]